MYYEAYQHPVLFQRFTLEGIVSVDGESGTSTFNSGGGSGGLLLVNASSLFGRGSLTSHGGNGLSGSINGQSYGRSLFKVNK